MIYEEDFNELINYQPIYTTQVRVIRRLAPKMPLERILQLSADEANMFINSIRSRYVRNSFEWLWTPENREKRKRIRENKALEAQILREATQYVSATTQVLVHEITIERISTKEART